MNRSSVTRRTPRRSWPEPAMNRSASRCTSTPSRPSWPAPACTWRTSMSLRRTAARATGTVSSCTSPARGRPRLRPVRVVRPRLERAGAGHLPPRRSRPDRRVDRLAPYRRAVAEAGRRSELKQNAVAMNALDRLAACAACWRGSNRLHDPRTGRPDDTESTLVLATLLDGKFIRLDYP